MSDQDQVKEKKWITVKIPREQHDRLKELLKKDIAKERGITTISEAVRRGISEVIDYLEHWVNIRNGKQVIIDPPRK